MEFSKGELMNPPRNVVEEWSRLWLEMMRVDSKQFDTDLQEGFLASCNSYIQTRDSFKRSGIKGRAVVYL
jgi:hypothetical protein